MLEISRLYPQYNIIEERRQQMTPVTPVAFERRSGVDRRAADRVKLDTTLTRDIFEIKNKVSKIQKIEPKPAEKMTPNTTYTQNNQNMTKVSQNLIKSDQFVKSEKPDAMDTSKNVPKTESQTASLGGLLAIVLGGTLATAFMGVIGAGIAVALGAYMGGKVLKNAIVSHLTKK